MKIQILSGRSEQIH